MREEVAVVENGGRLDSASPEKARAALRAAVPVLVWYALRDRGLVSGDRPPAMRVSLSDLAPPVEIRGEPLSRSLLRDRR